MVARSALNSVSTESQQQLLQEMHGLVQEQLEGIGMQARILASLRDDSERMAACADDQAASLSRITSLMQAQLDQRQERMRASRRVHLGATAATIAALAMGAVARAQLFV